jgi:hypothetical protein
MLKPVSILALDEHAAPLAAAVCARIAVDDLVQHRVCGDDLAAAIQSIHAQRQRPDSMLRTRDDISTRELVLLVASATGSARVKLIEAATEVRRIYEMRRLASLFTIEILLLLPEAVGSSEYAAAYGLLKALSHADPKPFDAVWLVDAMNAHRVRFDATSDAFAGAVAGVLTYEPELSGALPGHAPRGMDPTFSSFGYAELLFPRDVALNRLEPRFSAELLHSVTLRRKDAEGSQTTLPLHFLVSEPFANPLSRIESHQSLFKRFTPKTQITEHTRSAEELLASVRNELQTYRDTTHLQNRTNLSQQTDETGDQLTALLTRTVDETLDRDDYPAAIQFLDALVDPLPDLRGHDMTPRNVVTELNAATAALDARLGFTPNTTTSDAARKRVRELVQRIDDQRLVADSVEARGAAGPLAEMEREKQALLRQLPEILFAEEAQNNTARSAAREAEAGRLAEEMRTREQQLRELFAQRPRVEQALRDALESRRAWLWRQLLTAAFGVAALYGVPFLFGILTPNLTRITWTGVIGVLLFATACAFHYVTTIAPNVRAAREALARIREQIDLTERAIHSAHNDELQFEHDVMHRRALIEVLRRVRDAAKNGLDALRERYAALEKLASSFALQSIASTTLSISILDDEDVDAWYDRTKDDRKTFVRDFPLRRSESRTLPLEEIRTRVATYAATAFESFRKLTLTTASSLIPEAKLSQRIKRFLECSAPMIELRDDDLHAQRAMQRDVTLWMAERFDLLTRRIANAQVKTAPDALSIRAVSRVLHFPGYILGQFDYYRSEYEKATSREFVDVPDLLPIKTVEAPVNL